MHRKPLQSLSIPCLVGRIRFPSWRSTTVQLEAENPLPIGFLEKAQQHLGEHITRIGCLSWTEFLNYDGARRYYLQHQYHENRICATPVSIPGFTYETLTTPYKDRAVGLEVTEIKHVPHWPTPAAG